MIRLYIFIWLAFLSLGFPHDAKAQTSYDLNTFENLPVLHEGRIKPLETFARTTLKRVSASYGVDDMSASEWLLEALFDPARSMQRNIIKIRNPELVSMLGLEPHPKNMYSFANVDPELKAQDAIIVGILKMSREDWTQSQKDLLDLKEHVFKLESVYGSLSPFLPLSVVIDNSSPEFLKDLQGETVSYWRAVRYREKIDTSLQSTLKKKGEDISAYTDTEKQIALLSFSLNTLQAQGAKNELFRVVPAVDTWLSPWAIITQGKGSPKTQKFFEMWEDMVLVYHAHDIKSWNDTLSTLNSIIQEEYSYDQKQKRLLAEKYYNLIQPVDISFYLYLAALMAIAVAMIMGMPVMRTISLSCLSLGLILHIAAIVMRMIILERPPVSTLYESVIFANFIGVFGFVLLDLWKKQDFNLLNASIIGVVLHQLAFAHDQDGETMMMLTAVLNTNFWLATHVLTITAGYAFCIIVSLMAHIALIQKALNITPAESQNSVLSFMTLLSLLFCTLGTVLGGIWADQSWGRFWGWDPKENGALLIVLWLVWFLHARVSKSFDDVIILIGLAYTSVIVGLSWFGVNLLSIGLHSYGFTDALAWTLGLFISGQTLLLLTLYIFIQRRRSANHV